MHVSLAVADAHCWCFWYIVMPIPSVYRKIILCVKTTCLHLQPLGLTFYIINKELSYRRDSARCGCNKLAHSLSL